MPVKKSSLVGSMGNALAEAWEQVKGNDVSFNNFADLPPGIKDGVAKVAAAEFKQHEDGENKGKWYFQLSGVVVEPKEWTIPETGSTLKLEGRQARPMYIPLYDTPGKTKATFAEHLADLVNELKKLGIETESMSYDDIEPLCEALSSDDGDPVYTSFSTRAGKATKEYPDPRVWVSFNGVVDYEETDDGTQDTQDNTVASPKAPPMKPTNVTAQKRATSNGSTISVAPAKTTVSLRGQAKPTTPPVVQTTSKQGIKPVDAVSKQQVRPVGGVAAAKPAMPKASATKKAPAPEPEPVQQMSASQHSSAEFSEFGDLDSLAELANNDDAQAQASLTELAVAAGKTEEDVVNATDWTEVVSWITGEATAEEGTTEPAEEALEEPFEPEKGGVYMAAPLDPRTKKPNKVEEHEVITVDVANQTCALKNLATKQIFKGQSWGVIQTMSE